MIPLQQATPRRRHEAGGVLRVATFDTSLGWMAVAFRDGRVARAAFGYRSPREAVSRIESEGEVEVGTPLESAEKAIVARLKAFADGAPEDLQDIPIDTRHLTKFARRVVQQCRSIPVGQTLSYSQLADRAGSAGAARAVGNVMKSNRFPLLVPCHRVIGAGRSIGGYSAASGLEMKRRLLAREGVYLD